MAVYEYNGTGGIEIYQTDSPATGNIISLDSEPTVQPTLLAFSSVTGNSLTVNWTGGNGASSIVVMKAGSAVDSYPVDGLTYTANAAFGAGALTGTGNYVVYKGSGNSVNVTGLTPGTIYYISIYEFNGSGGNENYLISSPASGYAMAPPGNALDFDGTNDYVEISDSPANNFSSGNKFTVEFWCKVNSDSSDMTFVNKGGGFGLEQYKFDNWSSLFRFFFSAGIYSEVNMPRLTIAEGWVHIAGTYDGTVSQMRLYKNGVLVSSNDAAQSYLPSTTNPLAFGIDAPPTLAQPLNGSLDEVRIWNTVRTQAQIQDNMMKSLVGNEFGLTGYYKFDHASGTILTDFTANNNQGTLMNGSANTPVADGITNGPLWTASTAFNVWTGAVDTDWANAGNWSKGAVPTASTNVFIPAGGNQPTMSATQWCHHLVIESGATLTINNFSYIVTSGNVFNSGTMAGFSPTLIIDGISPQTIRGSICDNLQISDSTTLNLGSNLQIPTGGVLFLYDGTINLNGYTLSYGAGADLRYITTTPRTTSDIEWPAVNGPSNLLFGGTGGVTLHADRTLSGWIDIRTTLNANNHNLTVGSSWMFYAGLGGVFNPGTGTVTLNGTNYIEGSTTFYNLTKTAASANTLTFEAGTTQTITGTLTLQGVSGGLLSLRSTSSGSQWNINPQGTRTIAYLDVQDSNNTNATAISAGGTNSVNSGNNTNWNFNTAPVAANDSYITNEDTLLSNSTAGTLGKGVLFNDTDGESNPLTAVLVSDVSNGSLALNSDGSFTYTPNSNWYGTDTFTYNANDGLINSASPATVTITVNAVNDAPVITEGATASVTMSEDSSPTPFSLTLNATDTEGSTLTWSISTAATNGTASVSGTGTSKSITYTSNANYNGSDSFVVQVSDGTLTDTITVNVTIGAVNDPPVNTVLPTITGTLQVGNVLTANSGAWNDNIDTDVSGSSIITYSYQWQRADDGSSINLSDISGATSSTYLVTTGDAHKYIRIKITGTDNGVGLPATQSATVYSPYLQIANASPVIAQGSSVSVTMDEDGSPTVWSSPTITASDGDGDVLTWTKTVDPIHGTATVSGTGVSPSVNYTPSANYNGSDSFTVQVTDGNGGTSSISVNVAINARNDAPANTVLPAITGTLAVGQTLTANPGTWDDTIDTNVSGTSSITYTFQWQTADDAIGTNLADISGAVNSNYILTTADAHKYIRVKVTGTDSGVGPPVAQSVTVYSPYLQIPNAVPVITQGTSVSVVMDEDGSPLAWAAPTITASNNDGDILTWSKTSGPSNGTATVSGTGASPSITYTPSPNYNGTDSFVAQVSDGFGGTASITVNVTINPRNDAPNDTVLPTVTGILAVGQTLTVNSGTWVDTIDTSVGGTSDITLSYQWQRADDVSGTNLTDISGATAGTYILTTADAHKNIRVKVIGTDNGVGLPASQATTAFTVYSVLPNAVPVIAQGTSITAAIDEDGLPVGWNAPVITASDMDGDTLTWTKSVDSSHGASSVSGTGTTPVITYSPSGNFNGADSFTAQVSDGFGGTALITINITINARNDALVNTVLPSISGAMAVGQTLTADTGTWNDAIDTSVGGTSSIVYTYQWQRSDDNIGTNLSDIAGANASTYIPTSADAHKYIRVKVTGTDNGVGLPVNQSVDVISTYTQITNAAPVIAQGPSVSVTMDEDASPTAWSSPTITASDVDGDVLTWTKTVDPIHGTATITGSGVSPAITYAPAAHYNGSDSFVVQVSDGNGGTASIIVNVSINPRNDTPVNTVLPTITGTLAVGQTLTANPGTWDDTTDTNVSGTSLITYSYQWQNADDAIGTNLADISGAVNSNYILTTADAHKYIRVKVTGTDNGVGLPSVQSITVYSPYLQIPNAAPVIAQGTSVSVTIDEDGSPLAWAAPAITASDNDGDILTWSKTSGPSNGTATVSGTGASPSVTYIPSSNYNGTDSFVAQISDGFGGTALITINITINARNDALVNTVLPSISGAMAVGQTLTADTGTWNDAIDTSVGGTSSIVYTYQWQRADDNIGTNLSDIAGANASTYIPTSADAHKYIRVKVTGTDNGVGLPVNQSVDVISTYTQITNAAPVIAQSPSVSVTMDEDASPTAWSSPTITASDVDGDVLTWTKTVDPIHGTASVGGTGVSPTITYAPAANYNGTDSFTVQVSDGNGRTASIIVNVNINPRNDTPVNTVLPAITGTLAVGQTLTANPGTWDDTTDTNVSGTSSITYSYQWQTADDAIGTNLADITGAVNSNYILTTADAHKYIRVKVTGTDNGVGLPSVQSITVYSPYLQIPNAVPVITQGTSVSLVMDEDGSPLAWAAPTITASDNDGDILTWSKTSGPSNGTATVSGTGASPSIIYTPSPNYNGTDSFIAQVSDGFGGTSSITVNVTINPRNDAPNDTVLPTVTGILAVGQTLTVNSGTWVDTIDTSVGGTSDITLSYQWQRADDVSGTNLTDISGATAGTYILTTADAHKNIRVKVIGTDNGVGLPASQATTAFTVYSVLPNAVPVIAQGTSITAVIDEDGLPVGWNAPVITASDMDGDTLTWTKSVDSLHGASSVSGTGATPVITYSPSGNFNGADSFTAQVSDGFGGTALITINITINARNDAPVNTVPPSISGTMAVGQTLTADTGIWNDAIDTSVSGSSAIVYTYQWQRADDNIGTNLSDIAGATASTYIPTSADAHKYIRVKVTGTDNGVGLPVNQSIDVISAYTQITNAAPVIAQSPSVSVTMDEDGSPTAWSSPTITASDVDGDVLTWTKTVDPIHGTATVSGTGVSPSVNYTPSANYNGSDSFAIQVSDGNGGTASIIVNVSINPRNDTPVNTVLPTITGTLAVGQTLTANPGTWNDATDTNVSGTSSITYTYQWQNADDAIGTNLADITGAVNSNYIITTADAHKYIRVKVTGTDNGVGLPAAQSVTVYSPYLQIPNAVPVITQGTSVSVLMDEDGSPLAWAAPTITASDNDEDILTWAKTSGPLNGTATVSGTGASPSITYTPSLNYNGTDSFIAQVSDGFGGTASITVNVTINPRNDAPNDTVLPTVTGVLAVGQTLTVNSGTWDDTTDTSVSGTSAISNAYQWQRADDGIGTNLTDISGATAGTYILTTADAHKNIRVKVTGMDNGVGLPATQSTTAFTVYSVLPNAVPVIAQGTSITAAIDEDGLPVGWNAPVITASDMDGDILTWTKSVDSLYGASSVSGTGATPVITYSPSGNFNGADSFTAQVSDGFGGTALITINITINARNDAPVNTVPPSISGTMAVGQTLTADTGIWNDAIDTSVSGSSAIVYTYQWQRADDNIGTNLSDIAGATASTYIPTSADAHKYIRVKVTGTDNGVGLPINQSIDVISAYTQITDTAPVIAQGSSVSVTMDEDGSPTVWSSPTITASDADGDVLTWTKTVDPIHGTATITGSGVSPAITYAPAANYNGSDSFVVQVSDGNGGTASIIVNVSINPRNDTPVNTVLPAITGTLAVGQTLTANPGTWDDTTDTNVSGTSSITYSYQWQTADDAIGTNLADITGAVNSNYILTTADAHKYIRVKVTGTDNGVGLPFAQSVTVYSPYLQIPNAVPVITQGTSVSAVMDEDSSPLAWAAPTITASDNDEDILTWAKTSGPLNGTATVSGTGASPSITYTPSLNYNGTDSFVAQVSDGFGGTALITINITINARNDAPVNTVLPSISGAMAVGQTLTADTGTWNDSIDTSVSGTSTISYTYQWQRADDNIGTNLSDIAGATASTYIPTSADAHKYIRVKVTGTDNGVGLPVNQSVDVISAYTQITDTAPVIAQGSSISITMDEDASPTAWSSLTITASDVDGDVLTWSKTVDPIHGTATVNGTGVSPSVNYTPSANYNGSDSFTVQVSDGNGGTASIIVNVSINPRNDTPVNTVLPTITGTLAVGQTLTANPGTWDDTTDTNVSGTSLITYSYQWQNADDAIGTNLADISGAVNSNYILTMADAHKYIRVKVTGTDNGVGLPSVQSITVYSPYLQIPNAVPVIAQGTSVSVTIDEDGSPLAWAAPTITASDNDGDILTWSKTSGPLNGTATVSGTEASASITYTPSLNYNGMDSFVAQVSDGFGGTASITVNVTINPRNDAPNDTVLPTVTGILVVGQTLTVNSGTWVDTTDTSVGGTSDITLSYQWQRADDVSGTNLIDITGAVSSTYVLTTADAHKNIRVKVIGTDNGVGLPASQATTAFTVYSVLPNAVPVIAQGTSITAAIDEDGLPVGWNAPVITASDMDGDTLTWTKSVDSLYGTSSVSGTGATPVITYSPSGNFNGADSFTAQVSDGFGGTALITINITINARNDAPVNTVLPSITGTMAVGQTLTADTGIWNDAIDTSVSGTSTIVYTYQWQLADDNIGTNLFDIAGAAASTYIPTSADAHKYIRVKVTGTDNGVGFPATQSATVYSPYLLIPNVPVITWANPTNIVYGTALSITQLNATANIAGTFVYKPPAGTVLSVGTQILTADFMPDDTVNYSSVLGTSVQLFVKPGNNAPLLKIGSAMQLNPIDEDISDSLNIGTSVTDMIASSTIPNPITDPDPETLTGIAVTWVDNTHGKWQYNTGGYMYKSMRSDTGISGVYSDFPSDIAENKAVLLNDSSFIRFVPAPDFNGTASIKFRAWDRTSGNYGDTEVDTTINGGSTAFSINNDTATITVNPVNDLPVITGQKQISTQEDTPIAITLNDLTVTDPDNVYPADFTLTVLDGENYTHSGNLITPAKDFYGTLIVPVTVNDGQADSNVFDLTVTITAVNDSPQIEAAGTNKPVFTQNGVPVPIDIDVSVSDFDDGNFNSGYLLIENTNGTIDDQLMINNDADGDGNQTTGIFVDSQNIVYYNNIPFGVIDNTENGTNGKNLRIIFNSTSADSNSVSALLRAILFNNTNPAPDMKDRDIRLMVNNGTSNSRAVHLAIIISGDVTPPVVISTVPGKDTASVKIDTTITAVFSESVKPETLTTAAFIVNDGIMNIAGVLSYNNRTATFKPDIGLDYGKIYTVTITKNVKDLAGNALKNDYTWSFTTTGAPVNLPPINPTAISPKDEAIFAQAPATLKASQFSDPEGDAHLATYWLIRRADRMYDAPDSDPSFNYIAASGSLTEYAVSGVEPGLKYFWKVGYKDAGSHSISWSKEYSFKVGASAVDHPPAIPSGTTLADFRMASFTLWQDNPSAMSVLGDAIGGTYDTTLYKIGTYDPLIGGYIEFGANLFIEPGKAYWLLAKNGLNITNNGIPVTKTRDVDVKLSYNTATGNGWNMIACPNSANYSWNNLEILVYDANGKIIYGPTAIADLPDSNPYMDKFLWRWDNGGYASDTLQLEINKGYWVKAKQTNVFIRFPVHAQASISNLTTILALMMNESRIWVENKISTKQAIASSSDTPPMPIGYQNGQSKADGSSRVDNTGGGCFISTVGQE